MIGELAKFVLAAQFLTRLPLRTDTLFTAERLAQAPRYFPLVGLLVGLGSAATYWLAALVLPALLAVLLAVGAGLLMTGAFHEDGLADTFDGIGGGLTRERALEIMKDSRLGTYGAAALFTALALKAGALWSMPPAWICFALPIAHCISRFSAVCMIATSRYVREEGTGKPVAAGISATSLMIAGFTALGAVSVGAFLFPLVSLLFGIVSFCFAHVLMRLFFEPKLGGYTGDTLGAVQQASEIGFYLGLLAWL
ncbi:adenosylcobinamide-GDP ribazoletransferase [Hyphomonas sp.]|jgi:adenosylcobinamide-GDP ribazoletransferase|uniref:adenosylcobinamide-GDP ribazoletransferase n=1 Tax=Hyphomonas sp. TaxID=87 RepID=UPI0032D95BA3